VTDLLRPVLTVGTRPAGPATVEARYVRSFLIMRLFVGVLGVGLPLWLVFVDRGAFHGDPFPRGSLSAYYYSGMREVFVGTLSATGVFLFTYKVAERNLDNVLSALAGVSAGVIAGFPTGRPSHSVALTPLQALFGEPVVKGIHYGASIAFLVALTLTSFFFGVREGARAPREGMRRSPRFWQWYHWACAVAMVLALAWIGATMLAGWPKRSLLIGEWVSGWGFGASWLMKGLELDMLRGRPAVPRDPRAPEAVQEAL
jgi:hypothetical protein